MYVIIHIITDPLLAPSNVERVRVEDTMWYALDDVLHHIRHDWRLYQFLVNEIAVLDTRSFRTWTITADEDDDTTGNSVELHPVTPRT